MARRGRKLRSPIRQNLVEMLYYSSPITGYDAYKLYKSIFASCSQRSIYHHLQKGLETDEFTIESVADESGEYSWGKQAQKVYYVLGENAQPTQKRFVQKAIEIFQRTQKN